MLNNIFFGILVVVGAMASGSCNAAQEESSSAESDTSASRYSDAPLTLKEVPNRPKPLMELWQGYLKEGPLTDEWKVPTGMVISPNLMFYGNFRTGMQARDNGSKPAIVEWTNLLDVYFDFRLTGTERISMGFFPLHQGGSYTRYRLQPDEEFEDESNGDVATLFFEGELSEMFPGLDYKGTRALDYNIALGRQPILIQDGFIIKDIMDSFAVTRSTMPIPGTSYARFSMLYGWDEIDRSNYLTDERAHLMGLSTSIDVAQMTLDADLFNLQSTPEYGGDQWNIGLSMMRPFIFWNTHVDSTTRLLSSKAEKDSAWASTGTLLYSNFSWAPKTTDNIAYISAFVGADNYAAMDRAAGIGGPLASAGLLFAGNRLSSFGAPINNQAFESYGASFGYQMFFDGYRRNLIMEIGGINKNDNNVIGVATKITQGFGQHAFVSMDVFWLTDEITNNDYGLRSEFSFMF